MKDNNFKKYHQKICNAIDQAIEAYFHNWSNEIAQTSSRLLPHIAVLQGGCRGGKRIRGSS